MHVQIVSLLEQCVRYEYVVLLHLGQCKLSGKSRQQRFTYILQFTATSSATLESIQMVLKRSITGDVCESNERQK